MVHQQPSESSNIWQFLTKRTYQPLQKDLLERLSSLDPDMMTPREALDALYALKGRRRRQRENP